MTLAPRPLSLALLLLFAAAAAPAQTTPQTPQPAPPAVTASVNASGIRFAAFGAVKQTRLEVYDTSGAVVFDSGLLPGNVRDFSPRAAGLADGTYTCVLTSREVSGRLSIKQAAVALSGGEASLALGEAEAAGGADRAASPAAAGEGAGAATLSTHDGRDGALTSTAGALTLRTGDVLSGAEREHVRVTPDGRVGIGTDKPEATLDVAGAVRAAGGFRFPDGTTLTSRAGRLTLTGESGEELPAPSAAGTGTQNRLAKWAETGGAGTLTDSAIIESGGEVIIGSSGNTTGRVSMHALPGQVPDVRLLSTAVFNTFLFGNTFPSDLGARLTFAGANEGGLAAQGFSDSNAPAFRFQGHIGSTAPTQFPIIFEGFKSNGSDGRAPLGATEKVFGFYNGAFDAGGTALMTLAGGGNVGIGTTSPAAKLDVAGAVNSSAQYNIKGYRVLLADEPSGNPGNTFVGAEAGQNNPTLPSPFTGHFNTFVGTSAGRDNTDGSHNAFFGWSAGVRNTIGSGNIFLGREAGEFNTSGSGNIFIGLSSGFTNSTGNSLTLIGDNTVTPFAEEDVENATAVGARAQVTQSNSMVLGSIAGVNGATADTSVGIGTTAPKARLHVQGGSVYVGAGGQGVILKSPDGTLCRLLSIDNAGGLVTSMITCP